jgi:hypothetical protein
MKCVEIEDRQSMILNMKEHKHYVNLDAVL